MIAFDAVLIALAALICAFNVGVMLVSNGWRRWFAIGLISLGALAHFMESTPLLIAATMIIGLPLMFIGFLHQAEKVVYEVDDTPSAMPLITRNQHHADIVKS